MMNATQFCRALKNLRISQLEAAVLLHVHPRTTRRWAKDEREIPGPVSSFLDYLIREKTTGHDAIRALKRRVSKAELAARNY